MAIPSRDSDDFQIEHAQDHHPIPQVQCYPPKPCAGQASQGSRSMCILQRKTLLHLAQNLATERIIPELSPTLTQLFLSAAPGSILRPRAPKKPRQFYLTLAPTLCSSAARALLGGVSGPHRASQASSCDLGPPAHTHHSPCCLCRYCFMPSLSASQSRLEAAGPAFPYQMGR